MSTLKYIKHEHVHLKGHPEYSEKWLQDLINKDPSVLGLGDVEVLDRERRQEKAGRLDLLLADTENDKRYELELMSGWGKESISDSWISARSRRPASFL